MKNRIHFKSKEPTNNSFAINQEMYYSKDSILQKGWNP